jgi:hypothetical protein
VVTHLRLPCQFVDLCEHTARLWACGMYNRRLADHNTSGWG